jgi:hypothetical protein
MIFYCFYVETTVHSEGLCDFCLLPDTIGGGGHYVHGRKNAYMVLDENWKEADHLADLAIDGRLVLN